MKQLYALPNTPTKTNNGTKRNVEICSKTASKTGVGHLPMWYTEKLEVNCENIPYKSTSLIEKETLRPVEIDVSEEHDWLNNVSSNLFENGTLNISWSFFHASQTCSLKRKPCVTSLLPLFKEDSKSATMVEHGFAVIRRAISLLILHKLQSL